LKINISISFMSVGTFLCRAHDHGERDRTCWAFLCLNHFLLKVVIIGSLFFFNGSQHINMFHYERYGHELRNVKQSRMCLMLFFMLLLEINGVVETLLVCGNVGGPIWSC
jgi:hypothetical protein